MLRAAGQRFLQQLRPEAMELGQRWESSSTAGTVQSIELIRARIFGTRLGDGLPSGQKVLRKKLVGERIASYYPMPAAKFDPMFVDLRAERCWP